MAFLSNGTLFLHVSLLFYKPHVFFKQMMMM